MSLRSSTTRLLEAVEILFAATEIAIEIPTIFYDSSMVIYLNVEIFIFIPRFQNYSRKHLGNTKMLNYRSTDVVR